MTLEIPQAPQVPPTPQVLQEPVLPLGFTPVLFLVDVIARWAVLGLWHFDYVSRLTLWLLQIILIPVMVIVIAITRETKLQAQLGVPNGAKLVPPDTPLSIGTMILTIVIGGVQIYSAMNIQNVIVRHVTGVVTIIFYAFYALILFLSSAKAVRQAHEPPESSIDANDEVIIRLETLLASLTERVNAYTLESTLFGALAFSAFVTIVISEKAHIQAVKVLFGTMGRAFRAIVAFDPLLLSNTLDQLAVENTLVVAIAAQTLLCSAFYLSVIVCRLRFNDLVGRSNYCIRVAAEFNRKENEVEALALQFETPPERVATRLRELTSKISESLGFADESMRTLAPIVRYMSLFRNMGVLTFLTVLVVSALWISHLLAVFFAVLSLTAFTYPAFDRVRDRTVEHIVQFQDRYRRLFRGLKVKT
jgi:hypothetical protein